MAIPEHAILYCDKETVKRNTGENYRAATPFIIEGGREVDSLAKSAKETMRKHGGKYLGEDFTRGLWEERMFEIVASAAKMGMWAQSCFRIPLHRLPSATDLARNFFYREKKIREKGIELSLSATVTLGPTSNFVPTFYYDDGNEKTRKFALRIWDGWMNRVLSEFGGCPYWLGCRWCANFPGNVRESYYSVHRALKKAIDPKNIMYPGMILPEH
jgi:FAD/FMN-containing dehydrogenase